MFADTPNKELIRKRWDHSILRQFAGSSTKKLSYFGMPGPRIRDFIDWDNLLSSKTAVQIVRTGAKREEDLQTITKLLASVEEHNIADVQLLRGSVEEVILRGHDLDQNPPRLSRREASGKLSFSYDFVNLDFEGGAGYKQRRGGGKASETSGGQRLDAIRKLLDRQQGHSFILFLTVNVRDTLGDEPLRYLEETAKRIQNPTVQEIVQWTMKLSSEGYKHYQLKTWIPLFIKDESESRRFYCYSYPPVFYEGHEQAKMVHFAFRLEFDNNRDLRVSSEQDEGCLAHLPLMESADGEIRLATTQPPCFDGSKCLKDFDFLDKAMRRKIISSLNSTGVAA
jgi:hypothetical protein